MSICFIRFIRGLGFCIFLFSSWFACFAVLFFFLALVFPLCLCVSSRRRVVNFLMTSFGSYNPRNGARIGTFPISSAAEVACAVKRARERQGAWGAMAVGERVGALRRLRDSIAGDADALALVVAEEIGKPLQEAYAADVLALIGGLDWLMARLPGLLKPRTVAGEKRAQLLPMPVGVVGVIGTWNYPLLLDGATLAWALAGGNAVVWKPSELATASAVALYAHLERAGLPVTLVTGDGGTGQALCNPLQADANSDEENAGSYIDKLAFTGSVATGRAILAQLAPRGIPSVMELSGNDALIVCADAELNATAKAAVWARVCNAGQSCVSPQRVYVEASAYPAFLDACEAALKGLRAGVDYGPVRTDGFRKRAHGLAVDAVQRGARVVTGGDCLDGEEFANGFFYTPTLLADCRDEMPIMREDFFGPVLCVRSARDTDEAIALANANPMGLGASVWTRDVSRGRDIAARLKAGVVTINSETLMTGTRPGLPFGGTGASGWGQQRGEAGLDEFVHWKTVCWQSKAGAQRHVFPYYDATMPILRGFLALKSARGVKAKMQAVRQLTDAVRHWNKHAK